MNAYPLSFNAGPYNGIWTYTSTPGCPLSVSSSDSWLAVGTPFVSDGYQVIPYWVPDNSQAPRSSIVTFTGTNFSRSVTVTQDTTPGYTYDAYRANLVSISPASGTGKNQIFTIQAYGISGIQDIYGIVLFIQGADLQRCQIAVYPAAGNTPGVSLSGPPVALPSLQTLVSDVCSVDLSQTTISSSGNYVTAQVAVSFPQAFAGTKTVSGWAYREVNGVDLTVGTWTVPVDPSASALRIAETHTGTFVQGQPSADFTITVSNLAGAAPTSGTVTVTDAPLDGETVTLSGAGWNCAGLTCTRSDALAGGASYPPITARITVPASWSSSLQNNATVSGGGSTAATVSDYMQTLANPPVLTIRKTHTGTLYQGQSGAKYTIVVSNAAGAASTVGPVSVNELPGNGLTLVSVAGDGWTCYPGSGSTQCDRNDPLPGGASYPPLTAVLNIASNAPSPLLNTAAVSGIGFSPANVTDSAPINPLPPLTTIQSNVAGAPFQIEDGTVFTSPAQIYWPVGTQHTITWLTNQTGQTNARYVFQSWNDSAPNPRTITVSAAATYTADIHVQYQVAIAVSPAQGGSVTISPPSADGFYDSGASVTLTATPAPGYGFARISSDTFASYTSPATTTITGPFSATAYFFCSNLFGSSWSNGNLPAGPRNGLYIQSAGNGCAGTFTSTTDWFTLGQPGQQDGFSVVPFSVTENPGPGSRSANLVVTNSGTPTNFAVAQSGPGSTNSLVSVSPATGTGNAQVFSFGIYNANGITGSSAVTIYFRGKDQLACTVGVYSLAAQAQALMLSSTGTSSYLNLGASGTIDNGLCLIDGANSSVSSSGKFATLKLAVRFTPAFAGSRYIGDYVGTVGTWTVPGDASAPALTVVQTHSSSSTIVTGQDVTSTVTVTNQVGAATTSGLVTVTEQVFAGMSITSMQGDGWSCTSNTCTRSDALSGGSSYPPITMVGHIAADIPGQAAYNIVSVSAGGAPAFTSYDYLPVYSPPRLSVSMTHSGDFPLGGQGTFTITVSNDRWALYSSGTIRVTDLAPTGMRVDSLYGSDGNWFCSGNICAMNGGINGGQSKLLTATVTVFPTATAPLVNQVTVSGGGSPDATATDSVNLNTNPPTLSVAIARAASFYQGQTDAMYTITVSSKAGAPAVSGVSVMETLPPHMTLVSLAGDGWTCILGVYSSCGRSGTLPGGTSAPPIIATVRIDYAAPATLVNQVNAYGATGTVNASATDTVPVVPLNLSVALTHSGDVVQGQNNLAYTAIVSNAAGSPAFSDRLTVAENFPIGLSIVSMSGDGWDCSLSSQCTRTGVLNPGTSYPPVRIIVNVSLTASSPLVNSVSAVIHGNQFTGSDSTLVLPHGPAITIQSNVPGAPFSLEDNAVYLSPVTFYWTSGSQHTVTWLNANPSVTGARYAFQSWSDGGGNPRTLTAISPATYTANLSAQFLLTVSNPTPDCGTVQVTPASSDGYYSYGQTVTVKETASPGYLNIGFSGFGYSPVVLTMTQPFSLTALFQCFYKLIGTWPDPYGSGPQSGISIWSTAKSCPLAITARSDWATFGSPITSNGFTVIPYSYLENTGPQRFASVAMPGGQSSVSQDAAGSPKPNIVSLSPTSGTGLSQTFTVQAYASAGYSQVAEVDLAIINPADNSSCRMAVSTSNGVSQLHLVGDSGAYLAAIALPGAGTLQNSRCSLSAAASSLSGSGKILTVNFAVAFTSAFLGDRYITATAVDPTGTLSGTATVGTWTVAAFAHPAFFTGENALSNNVYYLSNPNLFGYYTYLADGWIYHFDLGYLYTVPGAGSDIYFWDLTSGHWWYSSAANFPYLYDFTLKTWIFYFPDASNPGRYTTNPRYFSNLSTGVIFKM